MKFTFKVQRETGKYRSFFPENVEVKLKKKEVGYISDDSWKIHLRVIKVDINEDKNINCKWKWITLKAQPKSLQEAKDILNENIDAILEKFNLYMED